MSKENQTILDLDTLLDSTLDTVVDLPDYLNPPTGNYVLSVIEAEIKQGKPAEGKEKAKPARIVLTYRVDQTVETEGMPVPDGTLFTEGFQGTEEGLGYFKKQAKKLLNIEDLNGVSIRDLLESLKDVQTFDAVLTNKVSKVGEKEYENVNVRPVFAAAE